MKFPSLRRSFQRLVRTFLVSSLTRSLKKQFFIFKNPNMISCIYTLPIKKYWQICLWARSIPQKNCLKTLSYKVVMARCNSYIPFPKCLFSIWLNTMEESSYKLFLKSDIHCIDNPNSAVNAKYISIIAPLNLTIFFVKNLFLMVTQHYNFLFRDDLSMPN